MAYRKDPLKEWTGMDRMVLRCFGSYRITVYHFLLLSDDLVKHFSKVPSLFLSLPVCVFIISPLEMKETKFPGSWKPAPMF